MINTSPMERMTLAVTMGIASPSVGWISLARYPDYFIGINGQVVSVKKAVPWLMSPTKMGEYDGYVLYGPDRKPRHEYRHRLVAEAVHGPCPDGMECRHIDSDKTNADFTNLEWSTHTANESDKRSIGTAPIGERSGLAKLTAADVLTMRKLRTETGAPYYAIAARFGVTTMTAHRAIAGKNWSHVK